MLVDPTSAASRLPASCGARLDANPRGASAFSPEELARIVTLQERLNQRLALHPRSATGDEADSYFPDLILVSKLIKLSWPVAVELVPTDTAAALIEAHAAPIITSLDRRKAASSGYLRVGWSAPQDAAQCAAILITAESVLRERDPSILRERVQLLVQAAYARAPTRTYQAIRHTDLSPPLARALVRRVRTFHAAGGHEQAHLRVPSRDCYFSAEEVPPLLPQAWFDTHFTGFLERMMRTNNWSVRHLRRAASLKLVEMTAGGSWSECAEILGIPRGVAQGTFGVLRRQMPGSADWKEFERAVERIAAELDSDPCRINYARRSQAMADWRMPPSDWIIACSGIPRLGRTAAHVEPFAATVLVWAEVTQAEHLHSPLYGAMRTAGQNPTKVSDQVAQFLTPANQKAGRLELRRRLDKYAAELAVLCDAEGFLTP